MARGDRVGTQRNEEGGRWDAVKILNQVPVPSLDMRKGSIDDDHCVRSRHVTSFLNVFHTGMMDKENKLNE